VQQPEPIRNIDQLTDRLWVGGDLPEAPELAGATIRWWHELGIRTIIDTRLEWTDEDLVLVVAPDIAYVHLGQDDVGQRIPGDWFDAVTGAARAGFGNEGAVLAHCHMGINRGPSAAYAILLDLGWDPVDAIAHIRSRRPIAAVGYADEALRWWHDVSKEADAQRHDDECRLERWQQDHPHDTVRIIRRIRLAEALGRAS
jgi:hypothetical protein